MMCLLPQSIREQVFMKFEDFHDKPMALRKWLKEKTKLIGYWGDPVTKIKQTHLLGEDEEGDDEDGQDDDDDLEQMAGSDAIQAVGSHRPERLHRPETQETHAAATAEPRSTRAQRVLNNAGARSTALALIAKNPGTFP